MNNLLCHNSKSENANNSPYSDIIKLPHHISTTHPRMSRTARAAQFAPYAALTGHRDLIHQNETSANQVIDFDHQFSLEPDTEYISTEDYYNHQDTDII